MRLGVEAALVDGRLVPGDLEIADGRVAGVGLGGAGSGIAVPGFVDLHIHGSGASISRLRTPAATGGRPKRCSRRG